MECIVILLILRKLLACARLGHMVSRDPFWDALAVVIQLQALVTGLS
jgi:hypothetical protein